MTTDYCQPLLVYGKSHQLIARWLPLELLSIPLSRISETSPPASLDLQTTEDRDGVCRRHHHARPGRALLGRIRSRSLQPPEPLGSSGTTVSRLVRPSILNRRLRPGKLNHNSDRNVWAQRCCGLSFWSPVDLGLSSPHCTSDDPPKVCG